MTVHFYVYQTGFVTVSQRQGLTEMFNPVLKNVFVWQRCTETQKFTLFLL